MKAVEFKNENEELKAGISGKSVTNKYDEGSAIQVATKILEECLSKEIFQERVVIGNKRSKNILYQCGEITFVVVAENAVIVIDSYIISDEWIGKTLKRLKKKVYIRRTTKDGKAKGVASISMQAITHSTKEDKGITVSNEYVALSLLFSDLQSGVLENLKRSKGDKEYSIVNRELHHMGPVWDNRLSMTKIFTSEEHNDFHSKYGKHSHQVVCKITSVKEMRAFIEYLKREEKLDRDK